MNNGGRRTAGGNKQQQQQQQQQQWEEAAAAAAARVQENLTMGASPLHKDTILHSISGTKAGAKGEGPPSPRKFLSKTSTTNQFKTLCTCGFFNFLPEKLKNLKKLGGGGERESEKRLRGGDTTAFRPVFVWKA